MPLDAHGRDLSRPRLIALSEEARRAIKGVHVVLERLPFKVGRESRSLLSRMTMSIERRLGAHPDLNDIYLVDKSAHPPQISREHFLIDFVRGAYLLVDRGSDHGTHVDGHCVGGSRAGGRVELHDQAVIVPGRPDSPFVFRFREK